jgi:hypothetical protein
MIPHRLHHRRRRRRPSTVMPIADRDDVEQVFMLAAVRSPIVSRKSTGPPGSSAANFARSSSGGGDRPSYVGGTRRLITRQ